MNSNTSGDVVLFYNQRNYNMSKYACARIRIPAHDKIHQVPAKCEIQDNQFTIKSP